MSNMVVRTNVPALNSHRNLSNVGNQQRNAAARLSSGFRINSAADDAAGLGISEKMRAQIRGLDQASRNAQDGISLIQTAEGAMSTVNEMVIRIRELVVQASNDTNVHDDSSAASLANSDRVRIQDEINQLMDEIDATAHRTEFNTRRLIDGSLSGANSTGSLSGAGQASALAAVSTFQSAVQNAASTMWGTGGTLGAALETLRTDGLSSEEATAIRTDVERLLQNFSNGVVNARTEAQADAAFDAFEAALGTLRNNIESDFYDRFVGNASFTAVLDAISAPASATIPGIPGVPGSPGGTIPTVHTVPTVPSGAGGAGPEFTRIALGLDALIATTHNVGPGDNSGTVFDRFGNEGALWFQIGANHNQGINLSINSVGTRELSAIGVDGAEPGFTFDQLRTRASTNIENPGGVNPTFNVNGGVLDASGQEIQNFIKAIDLALAHVTAERSQLGAVQNRLEFTIQNLDIASENLSAANSRIRDADMALEMMRLTQSNVLQQAATSMLAQANQGPQSVLQLLG